MTKEMKILNLEELASIDNNRLIVLPEYKRLVVKCHDDHNGDFDELVRWLQRRCDDPRFCATREKTAEDLERARFLSEHQKYISENHYALSDGTVIRTVYQLYEHLKEFVSRRDTPHNGTLLPKPTGSHEHEER